MNFNEYLKKLRKNKNLTQEELAEKINVSRQAIAKWEKGESMPDIENLKQLATIFNTSIDKLVGNKTEQKDTLNEKFNYIILFSMTICIILWIISKNLEFGFTITILVPSIIYLIKKLVLDYKYNKKKDIVNEKENLKELLPVNFYGKTLNTKQTKEAKKERIKAYFYDSLLIACVFTLIDVVANNFSEEKINLAINVFKNNSLNMLLDYTITFILFLIISTILNYIWYEIMIKKFNK